MPLGRYLSEAQATTRVSSWSYNQQEAVMWNGHADQCERRVVDGQYVLATCVETKAEGIFSGLEPKSLTDWDREHRAAHDRLDAQRRTAEAFRQARYIYRTTEPGDPARRGIGAYLNYAG